MTLIVVVCIFLKDKTRTSKSCKPKYLHSSHNCVIVLCSLSFYCFALLFFSYVVELAMTFNALYESYKLNAAHLILENKLNSLCLQDWRSVQDCLKEIRYMISVQDCLKEIKYIISELHWIDATILEDELVKHIIVIYPQHLNLETCWILKKFLYALLRVRKLYFAIKNFKTGIWLCKISTHTLQYRKGQLQFQNNNLIFKPFVWTT